MGQNEPPGEPPARQTATPGRTFEAFPAVGHVVHKTSRFSRELVATMISLASAAFGVVAALAWNTAITTWFTNAFGDRATGTKVSALFLYAVVATLVGVTVIVVLSRLAARIDAQPVEFRYPAVPKGTA